MKITFKRTAVSLASFVAVTAFAAPPSTSPYAKATLQSYVQDAASEGLNTPNTVICIMNAMSPAEMLSQKGTANSKGEKEVQYVALVDMNKCDKSTQGGSSGSSAGSNGSNSTPKLATAVVNVTRASNSSPMIGKIWIKLTEDIGPITVFVATTATTSPADAPPYGKLRIDYAGYSDANQSLMFNGFVDADGGNLTHAETGPNSNNTKLSLTATSTTVGSGVMQTIDTSNGGSTQVDLKFAYNADYFARNMGGADICFNRDRDLADKSVWQYGTYDATSGDIVDQNHPSFPLRATYSNNNTWGYASYWGINFGGVTQANMAALSDGEVTTITNITDQRPNHSETYRLYKNSGRLVKYMSNQATLEILDGVQINLWGDGCRLINGSANGTVNAIATPTNALKTSSASCQSQGNTDYNNWIVQWDKSLADPLGVAGKGNFKIVGVQSCNNNGCSTSMFSSATPLKDGFMNQPIGVWSNSLGQVNIPLAPGNTMSNFNNTHYHQNSDPIFYFTQATVLPSSSVLNLECLSNCPTASAIASLSNNPNGSPFRSGTNTQWGSGTVRQTYTFDATGLTDDTSSPVVASSLPTSGNWQYGVNSGRLFETGTASSSLVTGNACYLNNGYCEPSNPTSYYQYQTGPQMWNNNYWLTSSGSVVTFDPPLNISYNVPVTAAGKQPGAYDGKTVQLQFNGFGNIGIPGQCVNVSDNTPTNDCSGAGKRWVPAFALDDGTQLTIGSSAVLVKALNAELRLKKENCNTVNMSTSSVNLSLPTSSPLNPGLSSSSNYIGTQPTLTTTPAVIHGVIQ